jgi:hypothetical protein
VNSRIGHTPEKDSAKAFKDSEVKFLEMMRFTDRSMNTMILYLDDIFYDEVEKHVSKLNQQLVSVPKTIIQHPTISLLKFNEANFHLSNIKCSFKATAENIESTVEELEKLPNLDLMDLIVVINNELVFLLEQMNKKLREAHDIFSKIAEAMETAQNEFTILARRIEQVLHKRVNGIPSFLNKYSNQNHPKKYSTVLEEKMKKVKKALGSINNLMDGPGGLITQILYIQQKTAETLLRTSHIPAFNQHYDLSHRRKYLTGTKAIIMNEMNMLALSAKAYLKEYKRQEVSILMKKYSNTLTDIIDKDDLNSALEKVDNFQNIFADVTSKALVKKLTTISKKEKCPAEKRFLEF